MKFYIERRLSSHRQACGFYATIYNKFQYLYTGCKLRHRPDGFAEQNGRGAERADTLTL